MTFNATYNIQKLPQATTEYRIYKILVKISDSIDWLTRLVWINKSCLNKKL